MNAFIVGTKFDFLENLFNFDKLFPKSISSNQHLSFQSLIFEKSL